MNKILFITFFIALCLEDTLTAGTTDKPRSRSPNRKPKVARKTTPLKSTLLGEIPLIKSTTEMKITGDRGKISVDGVALYNDAKFKDGHLDIKSTGSKIYINGNLVAKPDPQDNQVGLRPHTVFERGITDFDLTIMKGRLFVMNNNKRKSVWYL